MSDQPACPACTLTDVLPHPDHWECATCGHVGSPGTELEFAL